MSISVSYIQRKLNKDEKFVENFILVLNYFLCIDSYFDSYFDITGLIFSILIDKYVKGKKDKL